MPQSYIVTCKDGASDADVEAAKQAARDQGGKIGHEYSLIKGFQVTFEDGTVHTLDNHDHVKHVEKDSEVKTQ